jgi:hypothetical protein
LTDFTAGLREVPTVVVSPFRAIIQIPTAQKAKRPGLNGAMLQPADLAGM